MPIEDDRARHPNYSSFQGVSAPNRAPGGNVPEVQAALEGDLAQKPMSYLLKAAAHYEATGHLHVGTDAFGVTLQFGLGKVVHALSPFHKGDEAVIDLFTWTEGHLTFENGRQPDKVTILDTNDVLISRGQAYVSDSVFLEENAISDASFLIRAGKLTPQELASTVALVPFYKPELLSEFYGNIYGTLNLKDAAARMNLGRSKWVSISALLLRLGLLLSPEGKSLKTIDAKALASAAANQAAGPIPLPGPVAPPQPPQAPPFPTAPSFPPSAWAMGPGQNAPAPDATNAVSGNTPAPGAGGGVPLPTQQSVPASTWAVEAPPAPSQNRPDIPLNAWTSGATTVTMPDAGGAAPSPEPEPETYARSVPLPKRTNDSVTISIKKSLDEMKSDLGGESPSLPRTAVGSMIKIGISPDIAAYGPSDLNEFWRVINTPETGILNREMFLYMLSHEFSRAYRFQEVLTLAVFSITFQNSQEEMAPIDEVCQIIRAVEKVKREVDLFGHFGDRSYALLLPRVDSARTTILVDRIHAKLPEMVPGLGDKKPFLHFGLASAPVDAASLALLVKTAHANMNEAAEKGLHRLPQASDRESDRQPERQPASL